MSLPQRLYQLYREVTACELVKTRQATPENMLQFQNLLNKAFPENQVETHQRELVRSMYSSSPVGFYNYVYQNRSRVGALVLWTESRCLAKFFRVNRVVHISFDEKSQQYVVALYIPRQKRADYTQSDESGSHQGRTHRRGQYFNRTPRVLRRFNHTHTQSTDQSADQSTSQQTSTTCTSCPSQTSESWAASV